jgi:UDP-N-acetylmuramate dehydrogenase
VLLQLNKVANEEERTGLKERVRELNDLRNETQDIKAMCAGCIFMNPTDQTDQAAAKLIDDLGLKGFSIGGAQVSERHANFIINTGEATADDVVQLISYIKQQVRDKKGIQLMEEVEYIGFE